MSRWTCPGDFRLPSVEQAHGGAWKQHMQFSGLPEKIIRYRQWTADAL